MSDRQVKRLTTFLDIPIAVEIERGETKSGVDERGQRWSHEYMVPYGEIPGTVGADGDPVDVYVGPFNVPACSVYVVHQVKMNGEYDEDKVLLGLPGRAEAEDCYFLHGPAWGMGSMDELSLDEFRAYLLAKGLDLRMAARAAAEAAPATASSRADIGTQRYGTP